MTSEWVFGVRAAALEEASGTTGKVSSLFVDPRAESDDLERSLAAAGVDFERSRVGGVRVGGADLVVKEMSVVRQGDAALIAEGQQRSGVAPDVRCRRSDLGGRKATTERRWRRVAGPARPFVDQDAWSVCECRRSEDSGPPHLELSRS